MIFLALLIYLIGQYIPSWISKKSISTLRGELSWKQVLFEFSGSITIFLFSFVLILSITLSTERKYLLNKNVVHGIEFSKTMENWGFKDGDQIVSINNKETVLFKDIIINTISSDNPEVLIKRGDSLLTLKLNEVKVLNDIIENGPNNSLLTPIHPEKLLYNTESQNFEDAVISYKALVQQVSKFLGFSTEKYKGLSGYWTINNVETLSGYLYILSMSMIFIGFINLLPLPGLDLGNALLIIIQKLTIKKFNQRKLKSARILVRISLLLLLILFILFSLIF